LFDRTSFHKTPLVIVGCPENREGVLDPMCYLAVLIKERHNLSLMELKVLIENGELDSSFDIPIISFKGKDTFNSFLQKVFAKTNIPVTNSIRLSAHSTRHFAMAEINRVSSSTSGFTANQLQNIRLQIGHCPDSIQMQTTYNNYLYQASTSLIALLSTDGETRSFSYTEPANLKRRFKMKVEPGKKEVEYDLDNIDLFKIMFLKEFELSDYKKFIKGNNRGEESGAIQSRRTA